MALFDQYGTDAVRYWSASARPGVDTAFSEDQMKVGRKLANKLLNVSKFVLSFGEENDERATDGSQPGVAATGPTDAVDLSMLAKLDLVIAEATTAFESFDYARALERTESFFWWFCDDYVELVKGRAYGSRGDDAATSARTALRTALDSLLRLLAPIMPFAAEEAWSWWHDASVHLASWPEPLGGGGDPDLLDPVCEVMSEVRRAKTEAKQSQRAEVAELRVWAPSARRPAIEAGRADLADAGSIVAITMHDAEQLRCEVVLNSAGDDQSTSSGAEG
jgi:valyl-tRNA synthetase